VSNKQENWITMAPGLRRRTIAAGDKLMQVFVVFDPHAKAAEHQHVHEQIATVVKGRLRLIVEGKPIELGPGQSYYLKSNIRHGAEALGEETHVLDTFSPPREDMLKQDAEGAKGR
jgi:quercetin dioxygenase-like cupin family protein